MTSVIINDILPLTQAIAMNGQTVYSTDWTANVASDVVVYSRADGVAANDATQILSPSLYSVSFVGIERIVQVTLVNPSTLDDIVTITRMTPANRLNLYTNTNFTPSMLNNDFGILTLVDQQAQLVNEQVAPRYNYSAIIEPIVDTILPILLPNQVWAKNPGDTAIVGYTLPPVGSGIAPADATYVTITDETASLPDSVNFDGLTSGIVSFNPSAGGSFVTRTLSGTLTQIGVANPTGIGGDPTISIVDNPVMPGVEGLGLPQGTTGQRPITPIGTNLRLNTSLNSLEYFRSGSWIQLSDNNDGIVSPGTANDLGYYATTGNTISPLPSVTAAVLTTVLGVPTWATQLSLALGGTNASLTASNGGIFYSTATAAAILAGTATAGQLLQSGSSAAPSWSTATYPSVATSAGTFLRSNGTNWVASTLTIPDTVGINTIPYASSANVWGAISAVNGGVLVTSATGVPSLLANPTATGRIFQSVSGDASAWSTATYPSIATGTGKILRADGTNWLASTATYPDVATGTGTILRADGTNWVATTATYPTTTTINQLFYSSANNVVAGLPTANSGVLTTDSGGIPSITLLSNLGINASLVKTVKTQVFTGSGTYTPSTGMLYCIAEVLASSAGGGGVSGAVGQYACGGGGGGGGYARKVITAATIGASQAVTIGAGGAGGTAGANNGSNGNTSSLGALVTASGGIGGSGVASSATAANANGGAGGVGASGDINVNGSSGLSGIANNLNGPFNGNGGGSHFGGLTASSTVNATGRTGVAYGSGGSGAATSNDANNRAGGPGVDGLIIITEFCNQ